MRAIKRELDFLTLKPFSLSFGQENRAQQRTVKSSMAHNWAVGNCFQCSHEIERSRSALNAKFGLKTFEYKQEAKFGSAL